MLLSFFQYYDKSFTKFSAVKVLNWHFDSITQNFCFRRCFGVTMITFVLLSIPICQTFARVLIATDRKTHSTPTTLVTIRTWSRHDQGTRVWRRLCTARQFHKNACLFSFCLHIRHLSVPWCTAPTSIRQTQKKRSANSERLHQLFSGCIRFLSYLTSCAVAAASFRIESSDNAVIPSSTVPTFFCVHLVARMPRHLPQASSGRETSRVRVTFVQTRSKRGNVKARYRRSPIHGIAVISVYS